MRLALIFFAGLALAQSPGITDAQRIAYRTLERDYFRTQLQIAALDAKGAELKAQIEQQHTAMTQACGGQLDEQALACKAAK